MKFLSKWFLWILLPVFNTLNQVALKMTAGVVENDTFGLSWFLHAAASPYIWMSFGCEIINFALWLAIIKRHTLSQAYPLSAISYAFVMMTSWVFFHEPVLLKEMLGVALIIAGIAVIGFEPEKPNDAAHA
jgi:multidrug transporter EmrE-like cation transporter